jgi:GNAT superfamily N-acetyltransferase
MTLTLRPAAVDDAADMAALLNEIITIGGTTAYEELFDPQEMTASYVTAPNLICCTVATQDRFLLGFQGLFHPTPDDLLPADWAFIATFARPMRQGGGVGRVLFAETLRIARAAGVKTIDATIRADNEGGLRFYSRLGFVDYDRLHAKPLRDGTPVDRIRKRLDL